MTDRKISAETFNQRTLDAYQKGQTEEHAMQTALAFMLDDIQARQVLILERLDELLSRDGKQFPDSVSASVMMSHMLTGMGGVKTTYDAETGDLSQRIVSPEEMYKPTPSAQDAAADPAIRPDPIAENGPNLQLDPRDAVIKAARKWEEADRQFTDGRWTLEVLQEAEGNLHVALAALDREGT